MKRSNTNVITVKSAQESKQDNSMQDTLTENVKIQTESKNIEGQKSSEDASQEIVSPKQKSVIAKNVSTRKRPGRRSSLRSSTVRMMSQNEKSKLMRDGLHREVLGPAVIEFLQQQFDMFKEKEKNPEGEDHVLVASLKELISSIAEVNDHEVDEVVKKFNLIEGRQAEPSIVFQEFLAIIVFKVIDSSGSQDIRKEFEILDRDKSGFVSAAELLQLQQSVADKFFTEEDVKEMIAMADQDHDGRLQYEEFIKILERSKLELLSLSNMNGNQ